MYLLALSNDSDDLFSIVVERDNWHHTMSKLDLFISKCNHKALSRGRFDEEINGVLYLAKNNSYFLKTEKNIINAGVACYPSKATLSKIMNPHYLLGSVLKSLHREGDKCADYIWYCYGRGFNFSSYGNLPLKDFLKNIGSQNEQFDVVINKDGVIFYRKSWDVLVCECSNRSGLTIKEMFNLKHIDVMFIGHKIFLKGNKNYRVVEVSSKNKPYRTSNLLSDDFLNLCKKIKKLSGTTLLKMTFAVDKDNNYYLFDLDPFPIIPKVAKKEYHKYIISKMKFIEKKVKGLIK